MQVRDDHDSLQLPCMNGCSRARCLRMNYDPSRGKASVHPRSSIGRPSTTTISVWKGHVACSGEKGTSRPMGSLVYLLFRRRLLGSTDHGPSHAVLQSTD